MFVAEGTQSRDQRGAVRGRLAPSPTGALHLGNARSFLIAWLSVRSRGGTVVLRMEDLDHPKVKKGSFEQVIEDLLWLGLDWDEGPGCGGPHAPYVQSERTAHYHRALSVLLAQGDVYPCICSRKDVESAQSAPHAEEDCLKYSGVCRAANRSFDEASALLEPPRLPAWRFRLPPDARVEYEDGFQGHQVQDVGASAGDFVIARHRQGAGYMLAVVVDDAAMRINEVIRGDDLMSATHRQLLLYRALNLSPPAFTHVPLVVGENGLRLAKRHGDSRLATLRDRGMDPRKVLGILAWWCGWLPFGEHVTAQELLAHYSLEAIPREPVVLSSQIKAYLGIRDG